jgi:signal transduction histidine kinase
LTLRLRLALLWGGLTTLVVLVVGVFAYAGETTGVHNELDARLKRVVEQVADRWEAAETPRDLAARLALAAGPGVTLRLHDSAGAPVVEQLNAGPAPSADPRRVLALPGPPAYDAIVARLPPYNTVDPGRGAFAVETDADGHRWRIYVLPVGASASAPPPSPTTPATPTNAQAYVAGAVPLRDVDNAVTTLRRLVPLLALTGGGAIFGAGAWLAAHLLRPISHVTDTAGQIAAARVFGQRVRVGDRTDELGQLAATFNAMLDSLEEAYRAQQRFVADASHELRTPLTAIQANLDLLARRSVLSPPERDEAIGDARRETHRLVRLVADLLSLARADAGVPLARRAVELDRLVIETVRDARHLAGNHRLDVSEVEPIQIEGDSDRLKEVLLILLDNAFKYTPAGGAVSVHLSRRDGRAALAVEDTGIGIAADDLPRVFERFYRADPARTRDPGSTGLGLSIARWIVAQHGGKIVLRSDVGRGTVATVTLPLTPSGASHAPPAS